MNKIPSGTNATPFCTAIGKKLHVIVRHLKSYVIYIKPIKKRINKTILIF